MSDEEPVHVIDNGEAHRFEAAVEGSTAVVEYNLVSGGIVIAHTEVPQALEGRGIASRMFAAVVETARQRQLRIIPVCPIFALWIKRHAEAQDVLDPSFRRSLGLPPLTSQ